MRVLIFLEQVIGGWGEGEGSHAKHSQSNHKPFSESIHTALTRAFTKHSQEHSQSTKSELKNTKGPLRAHQAH